MKVCSLIISSIKSSWYNIIFAFLLIVVVIRNAQICITPLIIVATTIKRNAPFVTTTIILPNNAKGVPNVKAIEDVTRKGFGNVKMQKGHNVDYPNHCDQR